MVNYYDPLSDLLVLYTVNNLDDHIGQKILIVSSLASVSNLIFRLCCFCRKIISGIPQIKNLSR